MDQTFWRRCGSCKKEIGLNSIYQACSVSTCSKLAFCSVDCWNQHVPVMNHKSAWAEERRSPRQENAAPEHESARRIIVSTPKAEARKDVPEEILIVASKLKQYIKDKYDMNTSANVMDVLSHIVRRHTDRAIEKARAEGRKTVMDRDFE